MMVPETNSKIKSKLKKKGGGGEGTEALKPINYQAYE
jgi:hypothetical protein